MNLQQSTTWLALRTDRISTRTSPRPLTLIERIAELAEPHGGVVARRELIQAKIPRGTIDHLVARGVLRIVSPGVYALGQRRLAQPARLWAALFGCGPDARIAGLALAAWLGFRDLRASEDIDVVAPLGTRRRPRRVAVHECVLHPTERRAHHDMPGCSIERMLLDVSAWHGADMLERIWREARFRDQLDLEAVAAVIDRHAGARGVIALRRLYDQRLAIVGRTDSNGEVRTRLAALAAGSSEPQLNHPLTLPSGRRARYDLFWPALSLVVEYDGPYHDDPEVAADDALRDAESRALGHRVERIHHTEPWPEVEARLRILFAELTGTSQGGESLFDLAMPS